MANEIPGQNQTPVTPATPAATQTPPQVQPVIQVAQTPLQPMAQQPQAQAPQMQPQPPAPQPQPAPQMQPQPPAPQPAARQPQQMPPRFAPQNGQIQSVPPRPGQVRPGAPVTRKPPNPKNLIIGCTGCSGAAIILFIIFVLIFVSQTSATGQNPMATSLGVDTGTFINTLILIVNLVFGALSVVLFLVAIVGLFRLFMARKDDKEAKKRGLQLAGISGLLLILIVGSWVAIYLFLSSKQVRTVKVNNASGFVTDPADTYGLTAPVDIKFDASKLPIDTTKYDIVSYMWDFGDGQTSTVPVTSHTYTDMGKNNGQFNVSLTTAKIDKQTKEQTTDNFKTLVTIANVKLNASFTADPLTGPAPLTVNFDASASTAPAGQIVAYDWDLNNTNSFSDASGVKTTYTFNQVGKYKVNLRVTDNTGQFAVVSQEIDVSAPNIPVALINIPTTSGKYFSGVQYSFQGDKSTSPAGTIQKYEWDFGDGSPKANVRLATHTYKSPGTYDVNLTVTDDAGKTGNVTQTIKIELQASAPIAVITTTPGPAQASDDFISGTVPFQVSFDGSKSTSPTSNLVDYKWDFNGDGTDDATGVKADYVFKEAGLFNATLTVIDAENLSSTTTLVVKAGSQPLQARITADPVEGTVPLTVTFDASSSSYPNGQIVSYEWDFGDGGPKRIDVSKVVYKYTKIGTFTAKVTAIASDNSRSTAETPVNVRPVALTSCFDASPQQGAAPLTVEFDPRCSSGTIAKYTWDFGDGETSRTRQPTHTFDTAGSYQVTLEVADNQNVLNTTSKAILVTGTI